MEVDVVSAVFGELSVSSVIMKVTVCFGSVRVLVPCGAGDLLVRDLVREATLRYKKATGQVSVSPRHVDI